MCVKRIWLFISCLRYAALQAVDHACTGKTVILLPTKELGPRHITVSASPRQLASPDLSRSLVVSNSTEPGVTWHACGSRCSECQARPPRLTKTRAHDNEISGLNHTAFDLAVASQRRSPVPTQVSLHGCWPSSAGRDWFPPQGFNERFHIEMILLFPSFVAQCQLIFLCEASVPSCPECPPLQGANP